MPACARYPAALSNITASENSPNAASPVLILLEQQTLTDGRGNRGWHCGGHSIERCGLCQLPACSSSSNAGGFRSVVDAVFTSASIGRGVLDCQSAAVGCLPTSAIRSTDFCESGIASVLAICTVFGRPISGASEARNSSTRPPKLPSVVPSSGTEQHAREFAPAIENRPAGIALASFDVQFDHLLWQVFLRCVVLRATSGRRAINPRTVSANGELIARPWCRCRRFSRARPAVARSRVPPNPNRRPIFKARALRREPAGKYDFDRPLGIAHHVPVGNHDAEIIANVDQRPAAERSGLTFGNHNPCDCRMRLLRLKCNCGRGRLAAERSPAAAAVWQQSLAKFFDPHALEIRRRKIGATRCKSQPRCAQMIVPAIANAIAGTSTARGVSTR